MWSRSTKQRRAAMRRKAWLRAWTRKPSAEELAVIAEAVAAFGFGPVQTFRLAPPKEPK